MTAALCRGGKLAGKVTTDGGRYYEERYQRLLPVGGGVYETSPNSLVDTFCEVFEKSPEMSCPCCGAQLYHSQNYMEAPKWLWDLWAKEGKSPL